MCPMCDSLTIETADCGNGYYRGHTWHHGVSVKDMFRVRAAFSGEAQRRLDDVIDGLAIELLTGAIA